ncbi:hypothetical protein VB618_14910 [Microvirga sp. CF3062]|uniref:hypothetical protein n=1 Tax=Microvirga sp. CF3062 TaxID=3110182 RepID=UPI002E79F0E8|nr:hypothetical protein [Microvirga sp. CF3062]MEE1657498.1 hypothetical protein [Microvirga sp. CF3062]
MLVLNRAVYLSLLLGMLPTTAWADFWADNCPLDRPKPMFSNGGFRLNKSTGLATEIITLNKDVTLRLEQRTCEYLSRTYIFILKERQAETHVAGWQYKKSVELLSLLEKSSAAKLKFADEKLDFADEKKALDNYVQQEPLPKEGVEIDINDRPYDSYENISVDSQIGKKDFRIVVKISSGPY